VDEREDGPADEAALENAVRKAQSVAGEAPGRLVLGVDTMVSLDGRIYGKPFDDTQARATLAALSGRTHEVTSGVCLIEDGVARNAVAVTRVSFRPLAPELIDWYLAGREWRGRAGGYAIQGRGAALVAEIEGDYLNVVGLPLAALLELEPRLVA
jgi:septum formation protein